MATETSTSQLNDSEEIKIPFNTKLILSESDARGCRKYSHPFNIPGFPGLHYRVETWAVQEYEGYSLRLGVTTKNPKYKDYIIHVEGDMGTSYHENKHFSKELVDKEDDENEKKKVNKYFYFAPSSSRVDVIWEKNENGSDGFPEDDFEPHFHYADCHCLRNEPVEVHVIGIFTIKKVYSRDIEVVNVPQDIQDLCKNEDGHDFTFVAGKKEIKTYKALLIHYSSVFATMLEREWKETIERKYAIPDFSHKIVQIALDILCGQKYSSFLTSNEYISLFQFADKYNIDDLKKAVKESIILTPLNVCNYLTVAFEKKCEEIVQFGIDYLFECFQFDVPVKNFLLLPNEIKILFAESCFKNKNYQISKTCDMSNGQNCSCK